MSSWQGATNFQRQLKAEALFNAIPGVRPVGNIDYASGNEPHFLTPTGRVVNIDGQILKDKG